MRVDVVVQWFVVNGPVEQVVLRSGLQPVEQTVFLDWRVALHRPGDVVLVPVAAQRWLQWLKVNKSLEKTIDNAPQAWNIKK